MEEDSTSLERIAPAPHVIRELDEAIKAVMAAPTYQDAGGARGSVEKTVPQVMAHGRVGVGLIFQGLEALLEGFSSRGLPPAPRYKLLTGSTEAAE